MALAWNRVDFLRSFDDALVDQAFKEFELKDLEFLFWYRAKEYQFRNPTERVGYLNELIELKDIEPAPGNTRQYYDCIRDVYSAN